MADGKTNGDIARALFVSEGTVKFHVKNILRKMQASNRADATRATCGSLRQDRLIPPLRAGASPPAGGDAGAPGGSRMADMSVLQDGTGLAAGRDRGARPITASRSC